MISFIVPCYNEQKNVRNLYNETRKVVGQINFTKYEFVFINDGSKDETLQEIKTLAQEDDNVKYISLSRNFGKEAAMLAGLESAKGNFVAVLDADMQHPPHLITKMHEMLIEKDCDCVGARRVTRSGEPLIRSILARGFYKVINRISDVEIVDGATDFRLMRRYYVDSLLTLRETDRFSKGLFVWIGFNTQYLEYENVERTQGETKWSFFSLIKYAINGITAFSTVPLKIASFIGAFFIGFAFVYGLIVLIRTIMLGADTAGFPSTTLLLLLIGGIIILILGIIGEYIAKIFLETKRRPVYLIKESNVDKDACNL